MVGRGKPGWVARALPVLRPIPASQAEHGRLFFAGEACSKLDFSTAHGAWLTGRAAADAVLAARAAA